MKISVAGPITKPKNIKGYMVPGYIPSTKREKVVAIIHIDGYISIFILFCDHQDSESK